MEKGNRPVVSVITVVLNDVQNIRRTLFSVVHQTWPAIEYIVMDGGSTDGTLEAVREMEDQVSLLRSEQDEGIYDAMNKALSLATGEYIVFMNSGDEFYEADTIEKMLSASPCADIYYGETEMISQDLVSLGRRRHSAPDQLTHASFRFGMSVSHQAILVRRAIAGTFNRNYQLSADIDWILTAIKRAGKIVNTHRYVAKYLSGGMSKKRHWESLRERFTIFSKHYGAVPNFFNHLVIAARLAGYYLLHRKTND